MSGGLLFCAYSSYTDFLLFNLALFNFLHSSLNVERQRYDTSPAEDLQDTGGITDTMLEETCYLSISCFQDTVQYHHHTGKYAVVCSALHTPT